MRYRSGRLYNAHFVPKTQPSDDLAAYLLASSSKSCTLIASDYMYECETMCVPDVSMTNRALILCSLLLFLACSDDVYFSVCPSREAPVSPPLTCQQDKPCLVQA